MSSKPISLADSYGAEQDVAEKHRIALNISVFKRQVEELEVSLSDHQDALDAANKVIETANAILAGPPKMDVTRAARCDKADAEKIVQQCRERIPFIEEQLTARRQLLATWEKKQKEFDNTRINAARELNALRNRMNRVRSTR